MVKWICQFDEDTYKQYMCVVKGIKYSDILVKIWYLVDLPHDIRVFSLIKTLILSILDDILQWMNVL